MTITKHIMDLSLMVAPSNFGIVVNYEELMRDYNKVKADKRFFMDKTAAKGMSVVTCNLPYSRYVSNIFQRMFDLPDNDGMSVFFNQPANTWLDYHRDGNPIQCSVNIMLDDVYDPVMFNIDNSSYSYSYKIALVDLQTLHGCATTSNRTIFRTTIRTKSFEECMECLQTEGWVRALFP